VIITSLPPPPATNSLFGPFPSSSIFGVRYSNGARPSRLTRDVSIRQTLGGSFQNDGLTGNWDRPRR
jgi:hypothetical protein